MNTLEECLKCGQMEQLIATLKATGCGVKEEQLEYRYHCGECNSDIRGIFRAKKHGLQRTEALLEDVDEG